MKNLIFIYFVLSVFFELSAQEFTTKIYFKDAMGNKDTIVVGYSMTGSRDTINSVLGEYNIPDSKIDTNFFIGISDIRSEPLLYKYMDAKFRTKVKYVDFKQPDYRRTINVDIICRHFPLKVIWHREEFNDSNRSKSCITTTAPGGWFDVGEPPVWLNKTDSTTFDANQLYGLDNYNYYIDSINSKPVKIGSLYIGFLQFDYNVGVKITQEDEIKAYPNPCMDNINLNLRNTDYTNISVYDLYGNMLLNQSLNQVQESINVSNLTKGIYFLKLYNSKKSSILKILKK
jgi:hypothetical protein